MIRIIRKLPPGMDYTPPYIAEKWYQWIEEWEMNTCPGKRLLVRRHYDCCQDHDIIVDYLTERTASESDRWKHITVVYLHGEKSPYPPHYDGNRHHKAPRRQMTGPAQTVAGRIFLQQE